MHTLLMDLLFLPLFQFLLGAIILNSVSGVLLSLTIAEQIVPFDILINGINLRIADIAETMMIIEFTCLGMTVFPPINMMSLPLASRIMPSYITSS